MRKKRERKEITTCKFLSLLSSTSDCFIHSHSSNIASFFSDTISEIHIENLPSNQVRSWIFLCVISIWKIEGRTTGSVMKFKWKIHAPSCPPSKRRSYSSTKPFKWFFMRKVRNLRQQQKTLTSFSSKYQKKYVRVYGTENGEVNQQRAEKFVFMKILSYFSHSFFSSFPCFRFCRYIIMWKLYLWFIWFCVISMKLNTARPEREEKKKLFSSSCHKLYFVLLLFHVNDDAWRFHTFFPHVPSLTVILLSIY